MQVPVFHSQKSTAIVHHTTTLMVWYEGFYSQVLSPRWLCEAQRTPLVSCPFLVTAALLLLCFAQG